MSAETFFSLDPWETGNATSLQLDPKHPGLKDVAYVQRREALFQLARLHRMQNRPFPRVAYTDAEHALWRNITEKLTPCHETKAATLYLKGLRLLNIDRQHLPQLADLNERLIKSHAIGLAPAEGLLHTRSFYHYLSQRRMPCTLFLRHESHPEYTPEPDVVHDLIGHVPLLTDHDYADLIELIGQGVKHATDAQLEQWGRIYWFIIEFSLIEEKDDIKVFGAGLLSSYGEMTHAYSDKVKRKPYHLEEMLETPYDNTQMQNILFVLPSIPQLQKDIRKLLNTWYG